VKPKVITFSGKARHGKDTSVRILKNILASKNKRPLAINYTDYLKFAAEKYLGWDGEKDEAGRSFLQFLGVEKIKPLYPTFWVDTVIRIVEIIGYDFDFVLIGDCRFEHDVTRWTDENYSVLPFHVERLNFENDLTEEQKNHATEVSLNDYEFADYISAGSVEELEAEIIKKIIPRLNL